MMMSNINRIFLSALIIVLSGCALPHDSGPARAWEKSRLDVGQGQDKVRGCLNMFEVIDGAVTANATRDAQSVPVTGFAYLHTTRFLTAMAAQININDGQGLEYWRAWLASTAIHTRSIEMANLSHPARIEMQARLGVPDDETTLAALNDCTRLLTDFDRHRNNYYTTLTASVNVADHYTDIQRVIGLYPLSRIPVIIAFNRWKSQNLADFSQAPSALTLRGTAQYYSPQNPDAPLSSQTIAGILERASQNPLAVPRPDDDDFLRLAASFAPVMAIDRVDDYDDIGKPVIHSDGTASMDTRSTVVYLQPSWTIFRGEVMLQINYQFWFSERPSRGPLDILSGSLDGLIWRVTIAPDGRPVLYDSIHPCGCYHLFFPAPPTALKNNPVNESGEGTVVPVQAPVLKTNQRMLLHISSGDHYLRNLSAVTMAGNKSTIYHFDKMDALRRLPLGNGQTRSLYDPQGLVRGTQRAERFILWPMGISSPGAMRQWGTHATAFTGRRHFDDPALLNNAFY